MCGHGTILRVWFPGCPLLSGNFELKSAAGSLDLVRCLESMSIDLFLRGLSIITTMVISICNMECVHYREVIWSVIGGSTVY